MPSARRLLGTGISVSLRQCRMWVAVGARRSRCHHGGRCRIARRFLCLGARSKHVGGLSHDFASLLTERTATEHANLTIQRCTATEHVPGSGGGDTATRGTVTMQNEQKQTRGDVQYESQPWRFAAAAFASSEGQHPSVSQRFAGELVLAQACWLSGFLRMLPSL